VIFFRAGRKHTVNLAYVDGVQEGVGTGLHIRLKGGLTVEMSRRQSVLFREALSL